MVEQSLELVADDPQLARVLLRALAAPALDKPHDHRGGAATDMFTLSLELDQAVALYGRIRDAARDGRRTTATRERGLGGFVAAWYEYVSYLERQVALTSNSDAE